jgi:hypothetical protein
MRGHPSNPGWGLGPWSVWDGKLFDTTDQMGSINWEKNCRGEMKSQKKQTKKIPR